jgi:hypothetical protein
LGVF